MNKLLFPLGAALCALFVVAVSRCTSDVEPDSYAVLAPAAFAEEAEAWEGVVSSLQQRHDAVVLRFEESPMELEAQLKEVAPRYVAVVDVPENIGRDYVIALNQMSRRMDEDPYADFLWGIITGYDAAGAQRMVDDAQEPMVLRTGVATIKELEAAKWFDAYAFVDDHQVGMRGEKKAGESSLPGPMSGYAGSWRSASGRMCRMCCGSSWSTTRAMSRIWWLRPRTLLRTIWRCPAPWATSAVATAVCM